MKSIFEYRNIWIPLVDADINNGTLFVLRDSHKIFDYPLPMNCPWPYSNLKTALEDYVTPVMAKADDLIVYLDTTLHGSYTNLTQQSRPDVHLGAFNPKATLSYYYVDEATKNVKTYTSTFSFYFENNFGNQDSQFPIAIVFPFSPPKITLDDVLKIIKTNSI